MQTAYSGAILAGGKSSRFSGRDKSKIVIGGRPIRDHLLALFHELFSEVLIVTNDPLGNLDADCHVVTDILPIRSALTGIHAGLTYAARPFMFFSACDTPFLKKEMVELILGEVRSNVDVVIPKTAAGFEPLCAVYAKRSLKPIERQLNLKIPTIRRLFDALRVKVLPEPLLRSVDPELLSFTNINTPEDLQQAQAVWNVHRTPHGPNATEGK